MTPDEFKSEEVKAFTAELGRATVDMLRKAASGPNMPKIDGRTALLVFADCLEQAIEDKTL